MDSREKFLEILESRRLSTNLKDQPIAMNWKFLSGKNTVTFYGVVNPIPDDVLAEIQSEVVPLILNESPECTIIFSEEVIGLGIPQEAQNEFNLFCKFFLRPYDAKR